jgi:uncharacterized protein YdcH (DUF465 family)
MEIDPMLVEKLSSENEEFKKLYKEHTDLKHRVEELNKMKFLSAEQELEKKTIQKQKLKLKDRLDIILNENHSTLH